LVIGLKSVEKQKAPLVGGALNGFVKKYIYTIHKRLPREPR